MCVTGSTGCCGAPKISGPTTQQQSKVHELKTLECTLFHLEAPHFKSVHVQKLPGMVPSEGSPLHREEEGLGGSGGSTHAAL